ncbi:hypothetical protein ACIBF5_09595 [Micromonospora sp. NPDC050417]|uniref:hypothetical protein n=1 Tax=Micromonospora sp. NPDC050417 TaxID=3364280 RepID=UPI0037B6F793
MIAPDSTPEQIRAYALDRVIGTATPHVLPVDLPEHLAAVIVGANAVADFITNGAPTPTPTATEARIVGDLADAAQAVLEEFRDSFVPGRTMRRLSRALEQYTEYASTPEPAASAPTEVEQMAFGAECPNGCPVTVVFDVAMPRAGEARRAPAGWHCL